MNYTTLKKEFSNYWKDYIRLVLPLDGTEWNYVILRGDEVIGTYNDLDNANEFYYYQVERIFG